MKSEDVEVARGVVFPREVQERMATLQREFDAWRPAEIAAETVSVSSSIRARCQLCGAEGVGGVMHVLGCGGSTPETPLEFLGYEEDARPG